MGPNIPANVNPNCESVATHSLLGGELVEDEWQRVPVATLTAKSTTLEEAQEGDDAVKDDEATVPGLPFYFRLPGQKLWFIADRKEGNVRGMSEAEFAQLVSGGTFAQQFARGGSGSTGKQHPGRARDRRSKRKRRKQW